MGYLTVKVNLNDWNLSTKLASAAKKAEHAVAVQIKDDTAPYVPMLNGMLRNNTRVKDNLIIYPGPYARYLYYGKVMVYADKPYLRRNPDGKMVLSHYGQRKVPIDKDLKLDHPGVDPDAQSHWFEASKAQNLDKWKRVAAKAVTHFDK